MQERLPVKVLILDNEAQGPRSGLMAAQCAPEGRSALLTVAQPLAAG